MSTAEEKMFEEAMSAIEAGERARARDLFTRLLKTGKDNPDYWLWMSAVVETTKERSYCLKEVLRLDPGNVAARRGLSILGAMPPDESLLLPPRTYKRDWQKTLFPNENVQVAAPPKMQFALMGVVLLILLGVGGLVIWGTQRQWNRRALNVSQYMPTNTVTPTEAVTATVTPTYSGSPTPLWMLLEATFTPTPLYVNTPHAASEAYRIGMRAYQSGEWEKAITFLEQADKDTAGSVDIVYYLGEIYRQQGKYEQALEAYDRAIESQPNFGVAYLGRARARQAAGSIAVEEVIKDLQTALEKDPTLADAYLELAVIQAAGEDPQIALETLDKAALLMPDSPNIYLYRAKVYLKMGDTEKALESAKRANQMDLTMLPAYRMMGEAMQAKGNLRGSLKPLETYVLYEPNDAGAWHMLAKAYQATKKTDQALQALDRALKMEPMVEEALVSRGEILLEKDSAEKALKDFRAALALNKTSFSASLGVGKALMGLKYPGDAWKQFEATRPLAKTDQQKAEVMIWHAKSLEELDAPEAALRDWRSVLEIPSENLPDEWVTLANQRISALVTRTPTPKPKTPTFTPTSTSTRWPTQTPTPTVTRKPTLTVTPTATKPGAAKSPTATKKP